MSIDSEPVHSMNIAWCPLCSWGYLDYPCCWLLLRFIGHRSFIYFSTFLTSGTCKHLHELLYNTLTFLHYYILWNSSFADVFFHAFLCEIYRYLQTIKAKKCELHCSWKLFLLQIEELPLELNTPQLKKTHANFKKCKQIKKTSSPL